MKNDVAVVIGFDVVETNDSRKIQSSIECTRLFGFLRVVEDFDVSWGKCWVQQVFDILGITRKIPGIKDFVTFESAQNTEPLNIQQKI